ncbi:MAG: GAF domain-containing sensor histidine kinase [Cyanobacteriota bacterium]
MEQNYYKQLIEAFRSLTELDFILVDCKGIITDISYGAKKVIGFKNNEVLEGFCFKDLLIKDNFNDLIDSAEKYKGYSVKTELQLKNSIVPFLLTIKPIEMNNNNYYLLVLKISSDQGIEKFNEKLSKCINAISTILNSSLEFDQTLDLILTKIKQLISYDLGCIMFLDNYQIVVKASKTTEKEDILHRSLAFTGNKDLESLSKLKDIVIIQDECGNYPLSKELKLNWAQEVILFPLLLQDSFYGLLVLFNTEKRIYSVEELNILEVFVATCAYSIKNAELSNVFRMQLKILKENVAERTKALELIKIQNKKILDAENLKNEFIAHISHELRTPLNAIIGFSEALKLKFFGDLNEKQEDYINDIHTSGIHLLGMINDILDLSKIEAKKLELFYKDFSIEMATNEVINITIGLANNKNITIEESFNHLNDLIKADQRKFQQILYNLISNSIKYSNNNSTVRIISTDTLLNDKKAIQIDVKDQGLGISEENIHQIFNKFYQIDNKYTKSHPGSGLGLTITKELVEIHRGIIRVESELDKGSTFTIILPLEP